MKGAALLLPLAFVLAPRAVQACAGCRNPNIPVARLNSFTSVPGEIRATVAATATSVSTVHDAGCADPADCHEVPVQPAFEHNQNLYPGELRAMIEVGLSRVVGVEVHVPFRVVHTTIRYTTPGGQPYVPLDADVHHRNETLVGLGDPWLLGRAGGVLHGWWLSARGGVSLPLGHTEENPFALGDQGLRHQHIQFGNGTFDPVMALDVGRSLGKLQLSAYGQSQLSLYDNRHGFRAGNRYLGGVQGGGRVLDKTLLMGGLDLTHDAPERWDGEIRQDGFLGRTELLAGLSLVHSFGETSVSAGVRVPLYRHIVAGNEDPGRLSSPVIITLTASRAFGSVWR